MKSRSIGIATLIVLAISIPTDAQSLSVKSVKMNAGENNFFSAVLDEANGYAYFGTNTSPCYIVKVKIPDMARVASLAVPKCGSLTKAVLDSTSSFAYFAWTNTNPNVVLKVNLSTFVIDRTLQLSPGVISGAAIDNTHIYFTMGPPHGASTQSQLRRVRLDTFTEDGTLFFDSEVSGPHPIVLDQSGLAYVSFSKGLITTVNLVSFAIADSLTLTPYPNFVTALAFEATGNKLYATTVTPTRLVKIDTLTLQAESEIVFQTSGSISEVLIDKIRDTIYLGTRDCGSCTLTPRFRVMRLSDLAIVNESNSGSPGIGSGLLDKSRGFAYFGRIICKASTTERGTVTRIKWPDQSSAAKSTAMTAAATRSASPSSLSSEARCVSCDRADAIPTQSPRRGSLSTRC